MCIRDRVCTVLEHLVCAYSSHLELRQPSSTDHPQIPGTSRRKRTAQPGELIQQRSEDALRDGEHRSGYGRLDRSPRTTVEVRTDAHQTKDERALASVTAKGNVEQPHALVATASDEAWRRNCRL